MAAKSLRLTFTTTLALAQLNSGENKTHDRMVSVLGPLFRMAGHRVGGKEEKESYLLCTDPLLGRVLLGGI